jgi:hypothetical protein
MRTNFICCHGWITCVLNDHERFKRQFSSFHSDKGFVKHSMSWIFPLLGGFLFLL